MAKANGESREPQGRDNVLPPPQPATDVTQLAETATAATREVESALLPDGRMIDLVRCTRQPQNVEFLVWQDGQIRRTSFIEQDSERLIVPRLDTTVISALRLPTMVEPCPPVRELFLQLTQRIETYVDVSEEHNFLITAFIFSTLFADRLSIVPYLSVHGLAGSGKTTLLRLLHCLCRRAIHASDLTRASLYRLAAQVRPTWLIDEADFGKDRASRDLQRLLRGGNRRGSRVLSNGRAYENFGPKVIASRVPLGDAALGSRAIHIVMTPSDRDMPELDLEAEEKLAAALQPMLEMFRLLHYQNVATPQYPGFLKFPPRLRDSARALAAPMLGDEELQERLAGALDSQVHSMRFDRFSEPEWVVMLALFGLCHAVNCDLYVGQVANEANRILRETGETRCYSAKTVGQILNKSLGFSTRRRGEGWRIELTLGVAKQIHRQAKAMGLNRSDSFPSVNIESGFVDQPCSLCSEFGLMMDHDGRRMQPMSEVCVKAMACTNCGAIVYPGEECSRCAAARQARLQNSPGEPSSGA